MNLRSITNLELSKIWEC